MSFVTYEPQGAVAYLIINRPEALNALNSQVLAELDAALDAIDLDAVRCLIMRGAGPIGYSAVLPGDSAPCRSKRHAMGRRPASNE